MLQHAAVIGGGISGLATALALTGRGFRVTLFEGDEELGGLGVSFPWRDTHLERFYHCLLPDDDFLLPVVAEAGLADELLWRETLMGFMYQKRIWPLNTPRDLLSFGPLTMFERLRMGLMSLRTRFGGPGTHLDAITAEDWVRDMVGDRCFEVLWKPLLAAKIGDHYAALPALWLSSRMNREKTKGPERKGCLRHGYRSLVDAIARTLTGRGATIRTRARVAAIAEDGARMSVAIEGAGSESFDFVVCTSPLTQFQKMTRGLPVPTAVTDLKLDYQGVVSAIFLTEKPLTPYYWMPWVDSGATAQGVIEMSNLVPLERTHGLHVNYLVNYTHRDGELFRMPDEDLLRLYRKDLEALFPGVSAGVEETHVFRAPFVEPIWTTGYAKRVPPTSVLPGRLYLACTAQVYPLVNSWNSCCGVVSGMMPRLFEEVAAREAAGARA